jgi:peroxiredoxin
VQTLSSELGDCEIALARRRASTDLVAEVLERCRQVRGFDPSALPTVGSPMPDGELTDLVDNANTLSATRDGRPAVVVFYRGGWCPYCNLTLRMYERDLVPDLRSRGATLIAISADTRDGSLTWHELTYEVLADPTYTIARQLGIMAAPPPTGSAWRGTLGAPPVGPSNGAGLPLPATVILDAAELIQWIDVHPDHVTRTESATIIQAMDLIAK